MAIAVRIKGGLGNQMFEYAAARALQIENQIDELVLDLGETKKDTFRPYSLDVFALSKHARICEDDKYKKYHREKNKVLSVLQKHFPEKVYNCLKKKSVYLWDLTSYRAFEKIGNASYLNGYWQSEKYFEKYKKEILEDFRFVHPLEDALLKIKTEMKSENSVSLHMRMGDYNLPQNKSLQVCSRKYYFDAIDYVCKRVANPVFYVFSDEIDKAKDLLKEKAGNNYVFMDNDNPNYVDLELMSSCKHFIMSNSSFSWWAQYLSDEKGKIVCAPERWTNADRQCDIYQDEWTLFSV